MNLPASFTEYTRALLGVEEYEKLVSALQQEPPVSIRLNRLKVHRLKVENALSVQPPWSSEGIYLDERLTFTFDPLFHAGCYYVQEASSMFVEQVLRQHVTKPVVMLDLCAAPGGKSTHARSVLPEGSLLVANEVIRNRSQILAENLTKWGHPDVVVTNNDPADFSALPSFFDVILTDVPCSGEGMFRKDSVAVEEWSPENVEICWQRQRRIIADVWPSLKPGGILIYSTSTYKMSVGFSRNLGRNRWRQIFGKSGISQEICCAANRLPYITFSRIRRRVKAFSCLYSANRKRQGRTVMPIIIRFRKENPPEKKVRKVGEPLLRLSPRKTWQRPENG